MMNDLGRFLLYAGIGLALLGGLFLILGRVTGFQPGQLPGDFSWERGDVTIHVPLGTMLVISIVLTVLGNLLLRLFR